MFLFLYRLVLFIVATFAFVVLFDHGTTDYLDHAAADFGELSAWVRAKLNI